MKRVLMLGWEYPPNISGGLGTACEGLTQALAKQGVRITFIVPKLYGGEKGDHMMLLDPESALKIAADKEERKLIQKIQVPAFLQPYWSEDQFKEYLNTSSQVQKRLGMIDDALKKTGKSSRLQYGSNIYKEVARFSSSVLKVVESLDMDFDVIHAHDWITYPAGVAVAQMTGKPLVSHVHSLEYDRSGEFVNPRTNDIEKLGVVNSDVVIAVSGYTRLIVNKQHNVPLDKVKVVHNGMKLTRRVENYRKGRMGNTKVVLFLGRITFQKGPGYFVDAAAKVLEHRSDVLFIMAGSGDLLPKLQKKVDQMGLSKYFLFPGFLKGRQVAEMYALSDVYVMPSVSEPFGIAPLESVNYGTPALISKQSGVSEVLSNSVTFDYWDVERMSDLILNMLEHPELRHEMAVLARKELQKISWDAAAAKVKQIYESL